MDDVSYLVFLFSRLGGLLNGLSFCAQGMVSRDDGKQVVDVGTQAGWR